MGRAKYLPAGYGPSRRPSLFCLVVGILSRQHECLNLWWLVGGRQLGASHFLGKISSHDQSEHLRFQHMAILETPCPSAHRVANVPTCLRRNTLITWRCS